MTATLDGSATTAEVRARSLPVDVVVQIPEPGEIEDRGRHRRGREIAAERARRRERTLTGVAATLVVVALLGAAGVLVYLRAAPSMAVDRAQAGLGGQLALTWAGTRPDPALGRDETPLTRLPGDEPAATSSEVEPVLQLDVPRLGHTWTVGRGVGPEVLADGPGLYPGMPPVGTSGNTAIAGHRMPALFGDLDRLAPGDPVVVRTRTTEFTFRVVDGKVVLPTDLSVLDLRPIPKQPWGASMLTLTTTTTVSGEDRRLVVFSRLESSRPR